MAGRMASIVMDRNRFRLNSGAPVQGEAAWRDYTSPAPDRPVPPLVNAERPLGAARWPDLPPRGPLHGIRVEFDHPRTGEHEVWDLVDPARVEKPGPVAYSGYPRKAGDADFIRRDTWVPAFGTYGDVRLDWTDFVWAADVIAANPAVDFKRLDGWDLRKLTYYGSDMAQARGKRCALVFDKAKHYVPDFTDGYNDGVRLGPNGTTSTTGRRANVQLFGLVGQGVESIVQLDPNLVPTAAQIKAMRSDVAPGGTNQQRVISAYGAGIWYANFVLEGQPLTDPADGQPLHHHGISMVDAPGSVMERILARGFSAGYKNYPPGETFLVGTLRCDHLTIRDCLLDGRTADGVRRSTSLLGTNGSGSAPYTDADVSNMRDVRYERVVAQYGRGGMMTFWLTEDVKLAHVETYSQAIGGTGPDGKSLGLDGGGMNWEESTRRARLFFSRHRVIGDWSSDTNNPDRTSDSSMWMSILSRTRDTALDMVIWEPWHDPTDFALFAGDRLAIRMPTSYPDGIADGGAKTHPMIHRNGRWLTGGDNIDMTRWPALNYTTPSPTADFVISR